MNVLYPGIDRIKQYRNDLINYLSSYLPETNMPQPRLPGMPNAMFSGEPLTWQGAGKEAMNFMIPQPEDTMMMLGLTKQGARWTEKAKNEFGDTWSPREAGYIAHDGTLLDFSGRNQGSGGGMRMLDHRDIGEVMGSQGGGTQGMYKFMNNADAIRMGSYGGGRGEKGYLTLHVMKKPTPEQISQLKEILPYHDEVYLDIVKPSGESIKSYELFNPRIGGLRNIFDKHFFQRLY